MVDRNRRDSMDIDLLENVHGVFRGIGEPFEKDSCRVLQAGEEVDLGEIWHGQREITSRVFPQQGD